MAFGFPEQAGLPGPGQGQTQTVPQGQDLAAHTGRSALAPTHIQQSCWPVMGQTPHDRKARSHYTQQQSGVGVGRVQGYTGEDVSDY